jgi:GT2 family glycosyltransferase
MKQQKSISIVIPNYNGKELLRKYLPYTINAVSKEDIPYEIIVVDDASTDDSVSFLAATYPSIRIIQNSSNEGFSNTCNKGLEAAKYELCLFLNSDIKLSENYFSHLWKYFDNPNTFGVMGQINSACGRKVEAAAKIPKMIGLKFKLKSNKHFKCNTKESIHTIFLSGANALVDTQKMRKLNGFDNLYSPYYFEDQDLSIRALRMGWEIFYEDQAVCYHLGSHTIKNHAKKSSIKEIYFRNRMIFHALHLNQKHINLWKLQLLFLEVIPKYLIGDRWILNSYKNFLTIEKDILRSRKNLNNLLGEQENNKSLFDLEREFKLRFS